MSNKATKGMDCRSDCKLKEPSSKPLKHPDPSGSGKRLRQETQDPDPGVETERCI